MTIRGPLITPVNLRRVPQQPSITCNLLLTTLAVAGVAQAPFRKTDWPNPVLKPVSMTRHALVATSYYEAVAETPAVAREFQNPQIKRKVQQPDVFPNLVVGPLFVPPTVPRVATEFQNPVIARRVQQPQVLPLLPSFAAGAPDTTPDAFTFTDQSGVALSATITSASITVAGINAAAAITISGGTYSINGGAFTASAGTVANGDTVRARHTASASYLTATNTPVTIGGVSDTFTSITLGDPAQAAYIGRPFSFNWWSN